MFKFDKQKHSYLHKTTLESCGPRGNVEKKITSESHENWKTLFFNNNFWATICTKMVDPILDSCKKS